VSAALTNARSARESRCGQKILIILSNGRVCELSLARIINGTTGSAGALPARAKREGCPRSSSDNQNRAADIRRIANVIEQWSHRFQRPEALRSALLAPLDDTQWDFITLASSSDQPHAIAHAVDLFESYMQRLGTANPVAILIDVAEHAGKLVVYAVIGDDQDDEGEALGDLEIRLSRFFDETVLAYLVQQSGDIFDEDASAVIPAEQLTMTRVFRTYKLDLNYLSSGDVDASPQL